MTQTEVHVRPSRPAPELPLAEPRTCRFAGNCSCVFQDRQPLHAPAAAAIDDEAIRAEITRLAPFGWVVVEADSREVRLEKRSTIPFCVNLALCVVTCLVWLPIWRARSRTVKTKVLVAGAVS